MELLETLAHRNYPLYLFGWLCIIGAVSSTVLIFMTDTQVLGINAWIKPLKFFLSMVAFTWTMAWFTGYLSQYDSIVKGYTWLVIAVLTFEQVYICWQAAQGQLSHFNTSSTFQTTMFSLMGIAISIMTLATAVIGYLFFVGKFSDLSPAYLWSIRFGIILFVIFAFEGGLMGARLAHTVGAADGSIGLPFLNWSFKYGDLRIAHFVGMHALQIIPLAGYYLFQKPLDIFLFAILYFALAIFVLIQALLGVPLFKAI